MRKLFTFLTVILFTGSTFAQTEIYEEHFADSMAVADYGFMAIDQDGDGYNWVIDVYESEIYIISESWDDAPLTPNNYLFTPEVDLSGYDSVAVEYFIAAASSNYYAEHYKFIVASDIDVAAADVGDILLEETLTETESGGTWAKRDFDISSYIDQNVYFAWVHYDCTDQYKLMLDSIKVTGFTGTGIGDLNAHPLTLYPNPTKDYLKVNYKGQSNATIEIYSVIGKLVKKINNIQPNQAISVSDLTSGTYMLKIKNASGVQTRQFIIE